jgi:hypothetical protein
MRAVGYVNDERSLNNAHNVLFMTKELHFVLSRDWQLFIEAQ